jgi:hypothetical protein
MRFLPESIGFEMVTMETLTGPQDMWIVTVGKLSGMPVCQVGNPHWLAYAFHRLKGFDQRAVPVTLYEVIRKQWLAVYHGKGRDVDEKYLDRLDPAVPFDWSESPPDIGATVDKEAVDGLPPSWWVN